MGAKILYDYVQNNKIVEINGDFLSLIIRTINGKRAVLIKKGKEILNSFKVRLGKYYNKHRWIKINWISIDI